MAELLNPSLMLSSKGNPFQPLLSVTSFYRSLYPGLVGEGWNRDGSINWKLRLPAQLPPYHNRLEQCPHSSWRSPNPSVYLSLQPAITCEQDTQIHNLLHLRRTHPLFHVTLKRCVSQDSPTMSRAFSISGWMLSIPGALPSGSFLNDLNDFHQGDKLLLLFCIHRT